MAPVLCGGWGLFSAWGGTGDFAPRARDRDFSRHGRGRGDVPLCGPGMHPPFSFPAGKENGPCTVQKKSALGVQLCPSGVKLDGRGLVVRCATKAGNLLPGALYRVRILNCTAAFGSLGADSGWSSKGFYRWPRVFRFATHYLGGYIGLCQVRRTWYKFKTALPQVGGLGANSGCASKCFQQCLVPYKAHMRTLPQGTKERQRQKTLVLSAFARPRNSHSRG